MKSLKKIISNCIFGFTTLAMISGSVAYVYGLNSSENSSSVNYLDSKIDLSDTVGDIELQVDPTQSYANNLWVFPEPTKKVIPITKLSVASNAVTFTSLMEWMKRTGNWNKTIDERWSDKFDLEFYDKSEYENNRVTIRGKTFPLKTLETSITFNNDGTMKLDVPLTNIDTSFRDFEYQPEWYMTYDQQIGWKIAYAKDFRLLSTEQWKNSDGGNVGIINNSFTANSGNMHNYFGIANVINDYSGNLRLNETTLSTKRAITNYFDYIYNINYNGNVVGFGNNKNYSVNNNNMYVIRFARNQAFDWGRHWHIEWDQYFGFKNGIDPSSLNFIIESNGKEYWIGKRNLTDSWPVLTGNNEAYGQKNNKITKTGYEILNYISNYSGSDENLRKFFNFSWAFDKGFKAIWGSQFFNANIPVFYNPEKREWNIMFSDFSRNNGNENNIIFEKNIDVSNLIASDYIRGITQGKYKNSLTMKWNGKEIGAVPSAWWKYVPRYTLRSDDLNGKLYIDINFPFTNGSTVQESTPPYIYSNYANTKHYYTFNDFASKKLTFEISGFDIPVTSFNYIDYLENDLMSLKLLGSNITNISKELIDEFVENKFGNGEKYVEYYSYLHLTRNDYTVSYTENNLRAGTQKLKIKLRKYVRDNILFENDDNGPEKEYTISNFYRINGRTSLNMSAIKVPSNWSSLTANVDSIDLNEIKNFIIDKQKEGVINTIESNYTDKSQEIFANLGNILEYHPEYLEILDDTGDTINGVKYIRYRLNHIYNTDQDNSNITNDIIEGTITLYGFKKTSNSIVYSYNTSAIYADDNGVIGSTDGKTTLTKNGSKFGQNSTTITNDYLILSQQYLHYLDRRVALVYDQNRPTKIILQIYNGLKLEREHVLDSPSEKVLMWTVGQRRGFNVDISKNINALGGKIYDENGTEINTNNFSIYFSEDGNYQEYTYSFTAKQNIYISIPQSSDLVFNRLLSFADSSNSGITVNSMLLYNQGGFDFRNNDLDLSLKSKQISLINFSNLDVSIQTLNLNPNNEYIYTASGYVDVINGTPIYSISYISVDKDFRTWYRQYILNMNTFSEINKYSFNITSIINFKSKDTTNTYTPYCYESFYFQFSQFSTGYNKLRREHTAIILLMEPSNYYDHLYGRKAKIVKISASSSQINQLSVEFNGVNFNNGFLVNEQSGFSNISFSSDANKLFFNTYINNQNQLVAIDLKKIREARNINSITTDYMSVLIDTQYKNNNYVETNCWAYSLNNKPQITYIGYSTNVYTGSTSNIKQIKTAYTLNELIGGNKSLNLIDIDKNYLIQNIFTDKNYNKFFNKKNYEDNTMEIGQFYKNYSGGSLLVEVILTSSINNLFEDNFKQSFVFFITGFTRSSKSTSIKLSNEGSQYFSNLLPSQYEEQMKKLINNPNLLDQYFILENHPTQNQISKALDQNDPYLTNITFDNERKVAYLVFNVKDAYIQMSNQSISFVNLASTIVEIPYSITTTNNMSFTYSEIYNTTANVTPYLFRQNLIDKPNGLEVTKLKESIINKLGIDTLTTNDLILSNSIVADNANGEISLSIQIPYLIMYDNQFSNINVSITELLKVNITSASKKAFYPVDVKPSMLQNWFDVDVENRALEFISIENPVSDPATKVISANVINFNDELKTARISFTIQNVMTNDGFQDTLTAMFDFDNLIGSSDAVLTSIDNLIEVEASDANFYAQEIAENENRLISLLDNSNHIYSKPSNLNISVLSTSFDNRTGNVDVVYEFDRYINSNGDTINKPITLRTTLTGFRKSINKTEVTYNNVLIDKSFEEFRNEIGNNPILLNNLVNITNGVEGANFSFAKAILVDDNTIEVYARLDKYFSGDIYNTIMENGEFKITVIRANNNKYVVNTIEFYNAESKEIISSVTSKNVKNYNYLWIVIPAFIFILSIIGTLLVNNGYKKKMSKDNIVI